MRLLKTCTALALASLCAAPAQALGLLEGYRQVLQNDPTLQAARYEHEAGQAEITLGRAGLLPQISASASRTRVRGTLEQPGCVHTSDGLTCDQIGGIKTYEHYPNWDASVFLRQPIFNAYNWFQYQQGKDKANYSNAVFDGKLKEAATRYLEAYLNVLLAQQSIELANHQIEALRGQLTLSKRSFASGETSVTDIDDAQARLDLAEAQRIESRSQLEINQKRLSDLVGMPPGTLKAPSPTLVLEQPDPASSAAWFELARQQSPTIKVAEQNMQIAKRELQKARAQHLPTIDLIMQVSKTGTVPAGTNLPETTSSRAAGVQATLPIFSGGYFTGQSSQALARYEESQSQYDATVQQVGQNVVTHFSGVVNGISKVKALRVAEASSEKALDSNKKGFIAGVRTTIDILNAEQQLYQTKRDLAQATFTYLLNWIQLKAEAGVLSDQDITGLDRVFTVSAVVGTESPSASK